MCVVSNDECKPNADRDGLDACAQQEGRSVRSKWLSRYGRSDTGNGHFRHQAAGLTAGCETLGYWLSETSFLNSHFCIDKSKKLS